ncbi:MAG: response regulator [Phycisphaerae bacterium]|nr:response regulator [Phycisphaerae bacterium]
MAKDRRVEGSGDARMSRTPESNPGNARDRGGRLDARVLIVASSRVLKDLAAAYLHDRTEANAFAASAGEARRVLAREAFDLLLVHVDLADCDAFEFAKEIADAFPATAVVLEMDDPRLDDAVHAMQSGAADILSVRSEGNELVRRLSATLDRAKLARAREKRTDRLRRLCKKLSGKKLDDDQTRRQEMAGACNDLSETLASSSMAGEFQSIIRGELDIESLLRAALQYILTKTGPTNAAIFLPATSGDFSLGAYVNYDGPKDSAEVLLESMAGVVAPKLERSVGLVGYRGQSEIVRVFGESMDWIGNAEMVAISCRHEGECLGVMTFYRDQRTPFSAELRRTLSTLAELFTRQVARVVSIHHRHLPKSQWGKSGLFDEPDAGPDIDLAA